MQQQKVHVKFLKSTILGGALFLVPLVALAYVLFTAIGYMRLVARPIVGLLPWSGATAVLLADLLAVTGVVLVCFLAGYLARRGMARWLVGHMEERLLMRIPGYAMFRGFSRSFAETAGQANDSKRVVLVNFDDQSQLAVEVEQTESGRKSVVFIPGSPEFNGGSLALVEAGRIVPTNMTLLELRSVMRGYGQGFAAGLPEGH